MASATAVTTTLAGKASVPKRNSAARIFGYDVFISFALGAPPRGTFSYASDLARRLRERDFTVFFSEDEASPGERLDSTLFNALVRSRTLVVIANRGTFKEPRWVRTEVEEFRSQHPDNPVIPINVDGALQDTTLAEQTQEWLAFQNTILLDESQDAVAQGIASEELVTRLAIAPAGLSSNAKWRWLVRAVAAALIVLAVGASGFGYYALKQSREARRQQGIAETNAAEAKHQQGVAEKNAAEAKRQQNLAKRNADEARKEAATLAAANLALQRSREKERSALANGLLAFPGPGNSLRKAGWKNANDLGLRGGGALRPGVRVGLVGKDAPAGTLCCVVEDDSGRHYLLAVAPVWP